MPYNLLSYIYNYKSDYHKFKLSDYNLVNGVKLYYTYLSPLSSI